MNETARSSGIVGPSAPASRPDRRPSWKYVLLAAPFLLGATLMAYALLGDVAAAKRQQTALGTINAHEPSNHGRYGYRFSVNGRSLSGWAIPHERQEYVIGQEVRVYYDPVDPQRSALEPFEALALGLVGPVAFTLAGSAVIVAMVLVGRFLGSRRSQGD